MKQRSLFFISRGQLASNPIAVDARTFKEPHIATGIHFGRREKGTWPDRIRPSTRSCR